MRHHEAFHRFFSRGTWNPDDVGRLLFERLMRFLPPGVPVGVAIDDTLAIKKGPEVFGLGSHIDAVRSTKAFRVFAFGHVQNRLAANLQRVRDAARLAQEEAGHRAGRGTRLLQRIEHADANVTC